MGYFPPLTFPRFLTESLTTVPLAVRPTLSPSRSRPSFSLASITRVQSRSSPPSYAFSSLILLTLLTFTFLVVQGQTGSPTLPFLQTSHY